MVLLAVWERSRESYYKDIAVAAPQGRPKFENAALLVARLRWAGVCRWICVAVRWSVIIVALLGYQRGQPGKNFCARIGLG